MKHIEEWERLIKETMDCSISHQDNVSIFINHNFGYVVIEKQDAGNLQLQYRRSLDYADIAISENLIAHNKIVSELVHSNYEEVKRSFSEFISKL